ncbi:hypothetical protein JDV02_002436 [Purpureocillium takamizusanense]|uniref:Uncharacterized protein n=1 Tax=Purpureocillium takamizusanense TaxID=2060973 RepID=A0A9Q8Q8P8_9HYPO|nr:uncharacterized protein JDV02_002436 [Purpureocillium takamizusanense]UNI15954.1 hypothetical protein JDV02_002436 [Purpureocillium takamizusanense]
MKASTAFVAATTIAPIVLTSAIRIDSSLPDGVYDAIPDESNNDNNAIGHHHHHIIRRDFMSGPDTRRRTTTTDTPAAATAALSARQQGVPIPPRCQGEACLRPIREALPIPDGKSFCRDPATRNMTSSDYHAALNLLFESPLYWVPPQTARFALHRGAVAYVCNFVDWNSASLVEFMAAMDDLDRECGVGVAGKRSLAEWDKFYGREARGWDICRLEYQDAGGIDSELMDVVDDGCETYLSGVRSWFRSGSCKHGNSGTALFSKMKELFTWYKAPGEDMETGKL